MKTFLAEKSDLDEKPFEVFPNGATTLSTMTLDIATFSIKSLIVTLNINVAQYK